MYILKDIMALYYLRKLSKLKWNKNDPISYHVAWLYVSLVIFCLINFEHLKHVICFVCMQVITIFIAMLGL